MENLKIEYVDIDSIKPYKNNAKKHPKEQIEQIKNSIKEFGMDDPIGIWKDEVVEGHGRLIACKELGIEEVPIIRLDHLSDEERKAYALAHNKLTMNSDFDIDILNDEIDDILNIDMSDFGFEKLELEEEITEDEIPEKRKETNIKRGDIYQLGEHRLMCGDSTSKEDVDRLIDNKDIKCVFTSPPYNMNANMYDGYNDNLASEEYIEFNLKVIENIKKYLKGFLFWNISYNKNSRWEFIEIMYRIIKQTGLKFMELIVWDKGHGMPIVSKDMLTRRYEDILMVGDEDTISQDMELYCIGTTEKKAYFNKKNNKGITNYWKVDTNNSQIKENKACFPVNLPAKAIRLCTQENDNIMEPFGGSGSTLIACEQLKRKCCIMEYDEILCQVIIDRWENFTGKKAIKLN